MKSAFDLCGNKSLQTMTIKINSTLKQERCSSSMHDAEKDKLVEILKKELEKKGELNNCNFQWEDDDTLVLDNITGLALHSFLLRAEELGKEVVCEKQTVLKIN